MGRPGRAGECTRPSLLGRLRSSRRPPRSVSAGVRKRGVGVLRVAVVVVVVVVVVGEGVVGGGGCGGGGGAVCVCCCRCCCLG